MSVQDTITAAVEQSMTRMMRGDFKTKYDAGNYDEAGEVAGSNKQFGRVIAEQLVEQGDIPKGKIKWATKEITKALDSYPEEKINGRRQNYFIGNSPEDFARDLAERVDHVFQSSDEGRGLIARLFGRGK